MFKVAETRCASCIFGPNSAIAGNSARMRELSREWAMKDTHQVCHAFGTGEEDDDGCEVLYGENVACRGWYDTHSSNLSRIAERLNAIEFVPQPKSEASQ